jgi:hydrogenase maturation protein HypF
MARARIAVRGIVQGVGFRPAAFRLAATHGLTGWVRNHPEGVDLEVQGASASIRAFLADLAALPAPIRVDRAETEALPEVPDEQAFDIRESGAGETALPVVPPDLATCPDCAREIATPGERRHRYPFTNCTYCGPRYTLIESLPYDRPRTAMKGFPLCPACAREYRDPGDRRFHAQPVACPACGPQLRLETPDGRRLADRDDALLGAGEALLRGEVLALKGLGGYQLLVDATSADAVRRLRQRKRREEKPFAVMFPGLEALKAACEVTEAETALLASPAAPILLLRRRPDMNEGGPPAPLQLAMSPLVHPHGGSQPSRDTPSGSTVVPGVAPGNPRLGAFLPYTPLHLLLLEAVGRPLVCTSGNLADEPMAFQDDEARARLGALADVFLAHDRPIVRPVDDSVLRVDADGPTLLRRARGYAPLAVPLPGEGPVVLALGAHQKATVALRYAGRVVLSQHLGDLASPESADLLARTVDDLLAFFRVRPARLACDLHPDYTSTHLAERLAAAWNLPLVRVQHHHAHGAACAAEHGLRGPVLALAWDGTGLGTDGTIWGGEALLVDGPTCRRVGHLKPFPLPGGEAAVHDPRRSAAGLLAATLGLEALPLSLRVAFGAGAWEPLRAMLDRGVNCPRTSSLGRLFDAVSALAGIHPGRGFEGQAAMALEFAAERAAPEGAYPWAFQGGDLRVADPSPMVEALFHDLDTGTGPEVVARRFHAALADLALAWARHGGLRDVVLSGGCFQNALLTALVTGRLAAAGFRVHRHRAFPPNDGCIAFGQAAVAALQAHAG